MEASQCENRQFDFSGENQIILEFHSIIISKIMFHLILPIQNQILDEEAVMTEERKRLLLGIFCCLVLVMVSGNIGHSIGQKSITEQVAKQVEDEQILSDKFSSEQVTHFLEVFYTFTVYGDNFASYEGHLTKKLKQAQKEQIKQLNEGASPQQFGNSHFASCQNYIRILSEKKIEVIAKVTHSLDLINNEGQAVTKGIENTPVLQLTYVWNEDEQGYLVDNITQLAITE